MTSITPQQIEDVFMEIVGIIKKHEMSAEIAYWMLGNSFCRFSQALLRSVEQVQSDIGIIYQTLPPPIEDEDEPNQ